jgi:hypothetical protein
MTVGDFSDLPPKKGILSDPDPVPPIQEAIGHPKGNKSVHFGGQFIPNSAKRGSYRGIQKIVCWNSPFFAHNPGKGSFSDPGVPEVSVGEMSSQELPGSHLRSWIRKLDPERQDPSTGLHRE